MQPETDLTALAEEVGVMEPAVPLWENVYYAAEITVFLAVAYVMLLAAYLMD